MPEQMLLGEEHVLGSRRPFLGTNDTLSFLILERSVSKYLLQRQTPDILRS